MENDQRIENFENFHVKRSPKEITLNNKHKEELNMDLTNNSKTSVPASQVSLSGSKGVAGTNTSSPKMGSRRIFTPQFKLQVLESYRNDHDCKGNQRATARKYNIHRRQIQKWLQCEPSLRSSVANINQNSVKHQFHNVSMQQQQQQQQQQQSKNVIAYTSNEVNSVHSCLDSTTVSTSNKSTNVPSLSSYLNPSSAPEIHDISDTDLAAVVAAAAAGTIPRSNNSVTSAATAAVVSPLRPSAIISGNRNTNSSISPLLHHHHHHPHPHPLPHHYGISTYSNISTASTVPMLVHHLNNTHQTPYPYQQSMPYSSPALPHNQTEKQQSASYFTPISLPTAINVISGAVSTSNSYTGGDNEHIDKLHMFPVGTKTYQKVLSDKNFLYNDHQFQVHYECHDASRAINIPNTIESFTVNRFNGDSSYQTTYPYGPMDLSLRHSRETKPELVANIKSNLHKTEFSVKQERRDNGVDVVDLTYRKRKVINTPHSSDEGKNDFPEKQQKFSNPNAVQNKLDTYKSREIYPDHATTNSSNSNEDDDIEIEVGIEEKFPPTSKPVKLFKPYLLDDSDNNDDIGINSNTTAISRNEKSNEIKEIAKRDDATINEYNTFPDVVKENINICVENSNFHVESRSESPGSACSPSTYIPTMSPTNFHYPKGSPASSGYESSTSTYSDTSLSSRSDTYAYGQPYSVNLQMQTVYHENVHILHQSKHVQRWLEKDDSNSLETNSTIALLV